MNPLQYLAAACYWWLTLWITPPIRYVEDTFGTPRERWTDRGTDRGSSRSGNNLLFNNRKEPTRDRTAR